MDSRPLWIGFAAALLAAGCGDAPFRVIAVRGAVAYEDGEALPSEGFKLKFVPQIEAVDEKTFPRIATAQVGPDGKFEGVTTYRYHDGLTVGEHLVYLQFGAPSAGSRVVPEEYLDSQSTPLRIDFDGSGPLDIRIPRP
ncbi:hypothetical protein [Botrimarina sp.]|uniref:hypothetical protein n=1 Tax=Botrimarina sp. TaxID=2795802 RepID=UPI0032EBD413